MERCPTQPFGGVEHLAAGVVDTITSLCVGGTHFVYEDENNLPFLRVANVASHFDFGGGGGHTSYCAFGVVPRRIDDTFIRVLIYTYRS